jgi:hypothetical protein
MAKTTGKKMEDDELVSAIDNEMGTALGHEADRLSRQRAKAMEYYYGSPYGGEREDHSQVVTREVLDTIEWIKPELMKLFASGTETVRFEPQNANDVPAAQQATDYINYLFHRKNDGFKILYDWITDGLLQKNGVVKVWWDDDKSTTREEYTGLTQLELQMLVAPDEVEVIEVNEIQGEEAMDPMGAPPSTFDVVIKRIGGESGLTIEVIPPEEFIISRRTTCLKDAPFCMHRTRKTISDLQAMGFTDTDSLGGTETASDVMYADEYRARFSYDRTDREYLEKQATDPTMAEVWLDEAYIRLDYDGDGIAELRKVVKVGSVVLSNDEIDALPFAAWTPIIIPHKFYGLSEADLVMDLQRIQSQLFRNLLDNQYLTNNGRYTAVEGMVNLDDLLTSRPHGVVRTKMAGAVTKLDTPQLGATAFQMLEYVDRLRERRTGVSERTQGMDPKQLNPNTAASAVNQVMTAAQQRVELIARVFGETGLTDLFRLMYKEVIQNQSSKDIFRLRDQYIEVDPSEWKERKDTSVVVGLGNGSRESEMMQLSLIVQNQQQMLSNPQAGTIVTPNNLYNALEDQVKIFNKAASGRYFTDPASPEAQQAAMAQQQQLQQQQQQQMALQEQQLRMAEMELSIKRLTAEADAQRKKDQTALDAAAQQLDEQEHEDKVALQVAELDLEYELEKEQGRAVALN